MQQLIELVVSEGVSRLTVGEIAARLRCSRRRLYEVASTKEELLHVAMREMLDDVLRRGTLAAAAHTDMAEAVVAYLWEGVAAAARLSPAFLADLDASDEGRAIFDAYQDARRAGLQALIDAGVARGSLVPHNVAVVAEAMLGASQRLRLPWVLERIGVSLETAFEQLWAVLLTGLLPRGTEARLDAPRAKRK